MEKDWTIFCDGDDSTTRLLSAVDEFQKLKPVTFSRGKNDEGPLAI